MTATIAIPTPPSQPSAGSMIHRDQHQIRAQFLNSLGIVRAAPPTMTPLVSSATIAVEDSDALKQPQHVQLLKYNAADEAPPRKTTRISFDSHVHIRTIPSYTEYDAATRLQLWNGMAVVAAMVRRNTLEYTSEGWNMAGVLEEDEFVQGMYHPVTYQRLQQEKKQKKKKKSKSYAYKSVAQCLSFAPPQQQPKRKSRRPRKTAGTTSTARRPRVAVGVASQ